MNDINRIVDLAIKTCEFIVSGQPIGKGRPRFSRNGIVYTDKKTKQYEDKISQSAWIEMKRDKLQPTEKRVSLIMTAFLDIPKSYSRKKVIECQAGIIIPPRPDIDNIAKAVLDGCNGIIYSDDKQIWHMTVFKRYTDVGQSPHIRVKFQWDDGKSYIE